MGSTIDDVAKLAEVSRQTVSRALNTPNMLSSETLRKVNKAIEMLDYHPNITARNLAINIVKTIGLFMPFTVQQIQQNMFFSVISATMCQHCTVNDFVFQLFTALPDEHYSSLFKRLYREKRVGGLVITCPSVNIQDVMELISAQIPFVLIGRPAIELEEVNYVDVDNVQAAYLATHYLLELGHRRIALLNAPRHMTLSEDLRKGLQQAFLDFSLPLDQISECFTDLTLDSGYRSAVDLLHDQERPTAFLTADDLLAVGAKKAADHQGLSIPHDLSLISAIKNGWGDLLPFELSHIDAPFEQLGILSAEYLVDRIQSKSHTHIRKILPVQLVSGESCGLPSDTRLANILEGR